LNLAAIVAAAAVAAAPSEIPAPSFVAPGSALALAAAGSRIALATGCDVYVADPRRRSKPVRIPRFGDCRSDESESAVYDVYLGRGTLVAQVILAPSPHGEEYSLWRGPLPRGPLRALGEPWGWTDSSEQAAWGCAWSVAAGGGVVALAEVPNRLAVSAGLAEEPFCPGRGTSRIVLAGTPPSQLTVPGSWSVLATDGKRIALARLAADGAPTGELRVVDRSGKRLAIRPVAASVVRTAGQTWLTPRGLVVSTRRGLSGPGWMITGIGSYPTTTVAEGRVFYVKRRTIRVRRLRDGVDRQLLTLRSSAPLLAAGSFGLAIAIPSEARTPVYRIPWRTIDRTLPR
jgi:hypothetical protein